MSDRETVTIDAGQFEGLKLRLDAISAALAPPGSGLSLYQILSHIERTLFDGFKLIAQQSGGDNSQVLNAIKSLNDKIDALALSIKEDSNTQIRALADDVKSVREKLQTSITKLKETDNAC